MVKNYLLPIFIFWTSIAQAQKLKKDEKQIVANLQQHIQYLADDKLQGRRTGTEGERLAATYIAAEFKKIGLQPKGSDNYYQSFEVNEGKQINPATSLIINGKSLNIDSEYFPLAYGASASVEAQPALSLQEAGMPWFFDIKEVQKEMSANPHFDLEATVISKAKTAQTKGATAFFVYNSSSRPDGLRFNAKDRTETLSIPVIYLMAPAVKKYLKDISATLDVVLKTDITEKKETGINIVGYIANKAATATVIIGAHFDHLGLGDEGNSRELENKGQIHNGADDNASGTAALLELARLLKSAKLKNNNYVFVAFSGEEEGLYGSKYFTENALTDFGRINYMINMDMVGRLNDSSQMVTVGGYGTSPFWGDLYTITGKYKLYSDNLQFRFDSSGMGPSDHTSFYLKDIPVLFYFTGLHSDYHKPTDDYDKINYVGEMNLVKHIYSIIQATDKQKEKLAFTKTNDRQIFTTSSFSVTLGIMPDYTYSGAGVRVDGISENRPAQKAGLKAGDIITSLGDFKVTSMESYMQALGTFKKGDKVNVIYMREGKTFSATVEF